MCLPDAKARNVCDRVFHRRIVREVADECKAFNAVASGTTGHACGRKRFAVKEGMTDITYPAAILAGLISFLSPCVLPLVPPYLSYLAGTAIEEYSEGGIRRTKRDLILAAIFFVLGFSTVFVMLGATASAFGQAVRHYLDWLSLAAGIAIIVMGLHFLGVFRLALLFREARVQVEKPVGLWGAYVMGLAFAFGWTPCIGPVLAAILAVASSEESVSRGAMLLTAYSFGLGIPFILAAFAMEPFTRFLRRFRSRLAYVEKVMGVLLVLTGLAFLTGGISTMSFWLLETFPALGRLG
jgi:cytochrome c-type biogenesis protein